jgi:nitronate monooxygenase
MALVTAELFGMRHPIAPAPMRGPAGGASSVAVPDGRGLGLLGGRNADAG